MKTSISEREGAHSGPVSERRAGKFTLVELLVVISIIAIIAALLMPALGKAREAARKAFCLSHLKDMAVSSLMYADNNKEYFPPGHRYNSGEAKDFWWSILTQIVYPKVIEKSYGIPMDSYYKTFQCPSEKIPTGGDPSFQYTHYGVNVKFTHYNAPVRKLSTAFKPSSGVVYMDSNIRTSYAVTDENAASERHGTGRANTSYLDGHCDFRILGRDPARDEKLKEGYRSPCLNGIGTCATNCN